MKVAKMLGERFKEAPKDCVIASHALMMRGGYMKYVGNGIYSLFTPAKRITSKIEKIIREEMDRIDGEEVLFPVVMPATLWEQSGRYTSIGSEMARFKDRGGNNMVLGMTHEEAAVHLARDTAKSYADFPFMIYQIQTKFRDEPRCRGGLIRVREFTMKDAYSFHMTQEDLEKHYYKEYDAYNNIFRRIGLKKFIAVKSDSGMMGGSIAHEFMLLTEVGEDTLVLCDECGYKSNMEVATGVRPEVDFGADAEKEEVFTGDAKDIAEVSEVLKVQPYQTIKAVVYAVKGEKTVVVAFIRGDLEVNEAKLKKAIMKNIVPWEADEESGLVAGNIGPIGLDLKDGIVVFDKSLEGAHNMVTGANKPLYHVKGVNVARDIKPKSFVDIAKVKAGDKCPVCGKPLHLENGIEIGNIFQLGTKYTKSMGMTVLNEKGEAVNPIMGCYGIGVGRAIAAIAQESNDKAGLILPITVAPYKVHICPLRIDDQNVREKAFALYDALMKKGVNVLLDDRENVSNGVKFADADLMGMPIRVVVSPRGLQNDEIEVTDRATLSAEKVKYEDALPYIDAMMARKYEELK